MTNFTLKDQRVVVIGGSSGIGLATAAYAAAEGARVIAAGRSGNRLASAAKLFEESGKLAGGTVEVHELDNRDERKLEAFFREIGEFDHLFTPGASYVREPIEADRETAESSFKGKFWPQYYSAKHAAPYIAKSGSMVLMSGGFSRRPLAGGASYAACNGAIESLGKALAVELSPVRVNVVSPGTIWREGQEGTPRGEHFKEYAATAPLGRVGCNEEIAHAVACLMTNTFMTGSTLYVDGGYTLL